MEAISNKPRCLSLKDSMDFICSVLTVHYLITREIILSCRWKLWHLLIAFCIDTLSEHETRPLLWRGDLKWLSTVTIEASHTVEHCLSEIVVLWFWSEKLPMFPFYCLSQCNCGTYSVAPKWKARVFSSSVHLAISTILEGNKLRTNIIIVVLTQIDMV